MIDSQASSSLTITILGSGTSSGVPLIGCDCAVCLSQDPKNHRTRASILVQITTPLLTKNILIDTSPDLRFQALHNKITRIDAVLYTHTHADHTHGIDELRSFNFLQKKPIDVFAPDYASDSLVERFDYIFRPKYKPGGGIPQVLLHTFDSHAEQITVFDFPITLLPVIHGHDPNLGYRFKNFAYITDVNEIPALTIDRLQHLDVLVIDCVKRDPHPTHFNLDQALDLIQKTKPKRAYLTHLGHDFDQSETEKQLPSHIRLAYDGLKIHSNF
jgi:phosphoribosyl 1,2-cyclic phosphate phosphodiesterase